MTGGHCWQIAYECDGASDIIKTVRMQIKAGAKTIKLMSTGGIHTPGNRIENPQFNIDELKAAIDEAHKFGLITGSHAIGAQGVRNAVIAGIDSVEHGCYINKDPSILEEMKKRGTYYVPTLIAISVIANSSLEHGFTEEQLGKAVAAHQNHVESFKLAIKSGVKIAFGTDRGTSLNYHNKGTRELSLMVEYGLTPMQAIVAATKNSSELLRINDLYGTLEIGKKANFIVLSENPCENIEAVLGEKAVYKNSVKVL